MAFGIIRARNLNAGNIAETDRHNARRYENEKEYPANITPGGEYEARYQREKNREYLYKNEFDLQKAIDDRLVENKVKGIRKNSNLAIEYVCTINDQKAWEHYSFGGYVANTKKWLEERHGKNSVVATYEHLDESNPHVHFVVVPLEEKQIKWKNQKGEGVRTEMRLNTRKYTGGRDKLRQLQDDYFAHLCQRYGQGEKCKLGVPIYRGTKIEHSNREYVQKTNHEIGDLRNKYLKAKDKAEELKIQAEITLKQAEIVRMEQEKKSIEDLKREKYRNTWHKKGTKNMPNIFHGKDEKKRKNKGRGFSR